MKKRIVRLIALVLILVTVLVGNGVVRNDLFALFAQSPTAYAVGDLMVDWGVPVEGGPIFTIENAKPGDSVSRIVTVNNGASDSRPVGVKGVLTHSEKDLEDALDITILANGTPVYGPVSLSQFFTDSQNPDGIALSVVNPNNSVDYTFIVTFREDAGDEYQEGRVVFDLIMGIVIDLPDACDFINLSGKFPIFGTEGRDRINGTSRNDVIVTFGGNDRVDSGAGNDCIVGGDGAKQYDGGSGNDVIIAGNGNNNLDGGSGNDIIQSGDGNNKINAGAGNDSVISGSGNDQIVAGAGDDTIRAGGGNDKVDAESGNDEVYGELGNDDLRGGSGNDTLLGDEGNDVVDGDAGRDTCVAETKKKCEL